MIFNANSTYVLNVLLVLIFNLQKCFYLHAKRGQNWVLNVVNVCLYLLTLEKCVQFYNNRIV